MEISRIVWNPELNKCYADIKLSKEDVRKVLRGDILFIDENEGERANDKESKFQHQAGVSIRITME